MSKREKIKGIFSAKQKSEIGTGTTKRRTEQTTYWYAEEQDNGVLKIQAINNNYLPTGPETAVEMDMFLEFYHPEPEMYVENYLPNFKKLNNSIKLGESHRCNGETYSAEHEFSKATSLDEQNVRANFGLGMTYLDRGEMDRADNIFRRLVTLEGSYDPEHKHLFNEFGISLRKNGMLTQALEYYLKAEKLVAEDENLHLNIARVHFELGDLPPCLEHLRQALRLNKQLKQACLFLNFLKGKGFIEECTLDQVIEKTADDKQALEALLKSDVAPDVQTTKNQARKKDSLSDELNFM